MHIVNLDYVFYCLDHHFKGFKLINKYCERKKIYHEIRPAWIMQTALACHCAERRRILNMFMIFINK